METPNRGDGPPQVDLSHHQKKLPVLGMDYI